MTLLIFRATLNLLMALATQSSAFTRGDSLRLTEDALVYLLNIEGRKAQFGREGGIPGGQKKRTTGSCRDGLNSYENP